MQIRAGPPESADSTRFLQSLMWGIATAGVLMICALGWLLLAERESLVVLPIDGGPNVSEPASRQIVVNLKVDAAGTATIWIAGRAFDGAGLTERLKLEAEVWDRWVPDPDNRSRMDSTLAVLVRYRGNMESAKLAIHDIYKACAQAHIFKVRLAALTEE